MDLEDERSNLEVFDFRNRAGIFPFVEMFQTGDGE